MSAGIDYGMGSTNVDKKTGIRYGVISSNSIMSECLDCVDFDYGEPTCPKCGNEAVDASTVNNDLDAEGAWPQLYSHGCQDYACTDCKVYLDSSDCFGDEAQGWSLTADGYQLTNCLDNDMFVLSSPYYTKAQFCSPCVPGAGNLDNPDEDGAETYCLGHDWFEGGTAPYPVYSVATRERVEPSK